MSSSAKLFGLLVITTLSVVAEPSVRYDLRFPNAVHHEASVRATFTDVRTPELVVLMSRSSPGRYALHEFAKNVYEMKASDTQGNALPIERIAPSEWKVGGHHGTVVVDYTVFGDLIDGTYAAIDATHAHLNMPAVLLWARGFENVPATLKFETPNSLNWTVSTQLQQQDDGTWSAPNLEWLMDSPVEFSAHTVKEWKVGDSTFRLALHHRGTDQQAADFAEMCKAVITEEEGVFGSFPKYDTGAYTFLIDYLSDAAGDGMEHRDSTVITKALDLKDKANQAIEVVAHEFFHSWNVKRIRPRDLEPFDFEKANMSGELWFAEGFTNYYGSLALKRAGLSNLDGFAGDMGSALNAVLNAPGRNVFDVIDMSRLAPFTDAARPIDPTNRPNTVISYYIYGQVLALGIDLAIRERFAGKSLDDWMRAMWREHPDIERPYTLADLEATLGNVTGDSAWAAEVFLKHVYGKQPMDYAQLLRPAGLVLRKAHESRCWIGVRRPSYTAQGLEITGPTLRDTPAYRAGLDRGDHILELDGKAIRTEDEMNAFLRRHKPGDRVGLRAMTRTGETKTTMELDQDPALELVTFEQVGQPLTTDVQAFRSAWLGSKAIHPLPPSKAMP